MAFVTLALASSLVTVGCSCGSTTIGTTSAEDGGGRRKADGAARPSAEEAAIGPDSSAWRGVQSHSGSRIKVLGYGSGDVLVGATNPRLRDENRGVTCMITEASDGALRCLPDSQIVVFTDANCTKPIAAVPHANCGTPAEYDYASESWTGDTLCPRRGIGAYALGKPIDSPGDLYQQSVFGCIPRGTFTGPETFREATEIPAGDSVRFERKITKVTDKLGVATWDGSDGSRLVEGAALLSDGTSCKGALQNGTTARCIPSDRIPLNDGERLFADSTCTQSPLASRCMPSPAIIVSTRPPDRPAYPTCPGHRYTTVGQLFRVGAEIDHSSIYFLDGTCTLATENDLLGAWRYYAPAGTLAFESFPIVGTLLDGTGRLQQEYVVAEDGTKLFTLPDLFYDNVAETECAPLDVLDDGRTFCVADSAFAYPSGYYDDSGCTRELAVGSSCGAASVAYLERTGHDDNGVGWTCPGPIRRISPHGPATSSFVLTNTCVAAPPPDPQPAAPLYTIGDIVDPGSLFPLLTPAIL